MSTATYWLPLLGVWLLCSEGASVFAQPAATRGAGGVLGAAQPPAAAVKPQQAEEASSRGLVAFHAGRYQDALALFDQALQVSPDDVEARYYRGVTYGRVQNFAAAIDDLRAVAAAWPDFKQVNLELGVALVGAELFKDAVPYLERAQKVAEEEASASFFLGIAQLRLGERDAARANFQRAAEHDPTLTMSARYYQGVINYQEQHWPEAQAHFESVVAANPDSVMGRQASIFLERLRGGPAPYRYQLYASGGFEYDSNVILAPSSQQAQAQEQISRQSDGRAIIDFGGVYVPWRSEHAQLSLGYEFFQSIHFHLHSFNLQDHRPSVQFVAATGPVRFGIFSRYDYYLRAKDSFLQQGTFVPFAVTDEGEFGRFEVFFRAQRQGYKQEEFSPPLDAWDYGPGARQVFYLGSSDRAVWLGYRYHHNSPLHSQGDPFEYNGNEVSVGGSWQVTPQLSADTSYAFHYNDYAAASQGRLDRIHVPIVALTYNLTEHFGLVAAYLGSYDDSNETPFRYNRNIGSITATVRY